MLLNLRFLAYSYYTLIFRPNADVAYVAVEMGDVVVAVVDLRYVVAVRKKFRSSEHLIMKSAC